ncbi:hypothetical protein MP228_000666 [Amoeboaphelidium protococcarum]|nr:hypothetical protein MP228_000666 [Amoeboaphelidium protococcarum]
MKRQRVNQQLKTVIENILKDYRLVDCFYGLSADYFQDQLKKVSGGKSRYHVEEVEDAVELCLSEKHSKDADRLSQKVLGRQYLLVEPLVLQTQRDTQWVNQNGIQMFDFRSEDLEFNEYQAICSLKRPIVNMTEADRMAYFKEGHLNSLMHKALATRVHSQGQFKKQEDPDKVRVLIWNSGAGFTESFELLMDACDHFDYLSFFDWEVGKYELHQRSHFFSSPISKAIIQSILDVNSSRISSYFSQFCTVEEFDRTIVAESLVAFRDRK